MFPMASTRSEITEGHRCLRNSERLSRPCHRKDTTRADWTKDSERIPEHGSMPTRYLCRIGVMSFDDSRIMDGEITHGDAFALIVRCPSLICISQDVCPENR